MTSTLTISHLTKAFGGVKALTDVSLSVAPGERVALLGHNGAGKSTLMKVILGLIAADSGEITVCGAAPGNAAAREHVAYLPENAAFHSALTGLEQISYYMRLRNQATSGAMGLLDRVGLLAMADKRADELSGGQRQRVGICRALIQNPKLLLVDEPTASLDPKTSRQIMRLICELCAERGLAAIINIHDVALAQMFVQRVVGLRFGAVEFDGPPEALVPDVLTTIYGEEDWEATIKKDDEEVAQ